MPVSVPTGQGHMLRRTRAQMAAKTDAEGRGRRRQITDPKLRERGRDPKTGLTSFGQRNRLLCSLRTGDFITGEFQSLLDAAEAIAPLTEKERRAIDRRTPANRQAAQQRSAA